MNRFRLPSWNEPRDLDREIERAERRGEMQMERERSEPVITIPVEGQGDGQSEEVMVRHASA